MGRDNTLPRNGSEMKIRILQNFNGLVNGKSLPFREGQEVDIDDPEAVDNFVRGHYAELLKPAVKVIHKPEIKKAVKVE